MVALLPYSVTREMQFPGMPPSREMQFPGILVQLLSNHFLFACPYKVLLPFMHCLCSKLYFIVTTLELLKSCLIFSSVMIFESLTCPIQAPGPLLSPGYCRCSVSIVHVGFFQALLLHAGR